MRKLSAFLFAMLLLSGAQAQRTCGTMDVHDQLMLNDPAYAAKRQAIDQFMQHYHYNANMGRSTITIPVVVHVVYNPTTDPAGNISDAQIQSQIARLNTDYNKQNADTTSIPAVWQSVAANCNVHFCLAVRDPNNLPTTGIVRVQTSVTTAWTTNDAVKSSGSGGDDAWPADSYLNIWVCNLGGGLLGYSQFPGGNAALDGCVILNTAFGDQVGSVSAPYNLGRTVTHEVGHWLNLYHTFQGGCTGTNDQCNDTPPTSAATYGCNTFPLLGAAGTCSTTSPGIMFMNYMDYSDDLCLYMFTNDQNTRIQANFASGGPRAAILNSLGCVPVAAGPYALFSADHTTICAGQSVTFTNNSFDTPTVFHWSFPGAVPDTFEGIAPPAITYNTPGTYAVTLTVKRDTMVNTRTVAGYITVTGSSLLPLQEGFQSTNLPTGWTIKNPDNRTAWAVTTTAGGYGTSNSCVFFNNAATGTGGFITGQSDYLYSPILNFTQGVNADTKLKFDYAYARKNSRGRNSYDTLSVMVSTDCGATWNTIWSLPDTFLATTSTFVNTGTFTPSATQWVTDSSNGLGAYMGQPSVQFAFVNYNGRGNAIYLDNINIMNTVPLFNVGINEAEPVVHMSVLPNPANDKVTINFEMDRAQATEISLYDMVGQKIYSKEMGTVHAASETISLTGLCAGVYIVRVKAGERSYSSRLVKQ